MVILTLIAKIKILSLFYFTGYIFTYCAGIGVTCGAHRLWSHRGYKATLPLRTLMMLLHTCAGQNDLYTWVRDHRVSFSDHSISLLFDFYFMEFYLSLSTLFFSEIVASQVH